MAAQGYARVPASSRVKANAPQCVAGRAGGLNWANYFLRTALPCSVIRQKDKTGVCNWHCYFISTSILKQ